MSWYNGYIGWKMSSQLVSTTGGREERKMTILDDSSVDELDEDKEKCNRCLEYFPADDIEVCRVCNNGVCHTDCSRYCNECDSIVCNNCYDSRDRWDMCEYCADRHEECYRCGGAAYESSTVHNDGYQTYCGGCVENHASWCDRHDVYHDDDNPCRTSLVHDYSYKPMPEFHHMDNDIDADRNMYFGAELEVEDCDSYGGGPRIVQEILGDFAYCKHDGSLDDGFEIVTHPMTLAYAQNLPLVVLSKRLKDTGHRSWDTDTCGLHVHIDRRAFTGNKHTYAFSLLLMRNRALSFIIAGRANNHYASFDEDNRKQIPLALKQRYRGMERYTAVNCNPHSTIEVRMFRGSLKPERILCAIEYLHAAIDYTRGVKTGLESSEYLTAPAFIQWARSKRDLYPNLINYINTSAEFGISTRTPRVQIDGE